MSDLFDPEPQPSPSAQRAIDLATALVTTALRNEVDRRLRNQLEWLVWQAFEEGAVGDVIAVLAFGFAQKFEELARLKDEDVYEMWQHWCLHEQTKRLW